MIVVQCGFRFKARHSRTEVVVIRPPRDGLSVLVDLYNQDVQCNRARVFDVEKLAAGAQRQRAVILDPFVDAETDEIMRAVLSSDETPRSVIDFLLGG